MIAHELGGVGWLHAVTVSGPRCNRVDSTVTQPPQASSTVHHMLPTSQACLLPSSHSRQSIHSSASMHRSQLRPSPSQRSALPERLSHVLCGPTQRPEDSEECQGACTPGKWTPRHFPERSSLRRRVASAHSARLVSPVWSKFGDSHASIHDRQEITSLSPHTRSLTRHLHPAGARSPATFGLA